MKKGKISSIIGLLFASSFLIRTVVIHQMRASKKQESEKIAAVQEFIKSQEQAEAEKQKDTFKGILGNGSGTSEPRPSYDKTIFVNQQYDIGVRDGAYYLLTLSSNKEVLLEGVDDAYALAVIGNQLPLLKGIPSIYLQIASYVLTMVVLAAFFGQSVAPKADGVNYIKSK